MKNIQEAMSPLLTVLCLCGFGVFEYPLGRPRLHLTILYILISWLLYICAIIQAKIYLNKHDIDLYIFAKINIIFAVLAVLFNLYHDKKLKNCLRKLSAVNDTLEGLGTPKSYARMRTQIKCLIIAWIGSIFFMNTVDTVWYFQSIPSTYAVIGICMSYVMNHTLHINALADVLRMILLRYIGSRFEQINRHLEKLTQRRTQVKCVRTTRSLPLIRRYMTDIETPTQIILISMHVHHELRSITRELTDMFGIHMIMQALASNLFTAQLIILIYKTIMKASTESTYETAINIFVSYIWIATNVVKMIIFNLICEGISSKANKVELFLNRLANNFLDIEMQEYIIQFLFQLLQRPLKISGHGLYFGYKFLRQYVNYIGTVIIVTLQSHQSNANDPHK